MHAVIYSKPYVGSDTIATLTKWEYTFHGHNEKVRPYLAGFHRYDYWGVPILSISHDSSWAEVFVASSDWTTKTKGWINLKIPNTTVRVWADFLRTQSMVLNGNNPPRFYSKPNKSAPLSMNLFRFRSLDEFSYILKPIRREGRWLLVELHTPFLPCADEDAVVHEPGLHPRTTRVWIEYIDERGRPLAQAPMMC